LLAACQPPIVFQVNSTADAVDANPGDGSCQTAAGDCTLRAAIQEANAEQVTATIDLQSAAHYTLSIPGTGEDQAATGDLDVRTHLTIDGNGSTIDADHIDRVFDLPSDANAASLAISNATITGGVASDGGGIHNDTTGGVTLSFTTVDGNVSNGSSFCLVEDGNAIQCSGDTNGGGIGSFGLVTLVGSTVSHNQNTAQEGCVEATGPFGQPTGVFGCSFTGGGGIAAKVVASNSTISDNSTTGVGGGIADGTVLGGNAINDASSLTHVTMVGNTAQGGGNAIAVAMTLSGTAISGPSPLCGPTQPLFGGQPGGGAPTSKGYNAATDGTCALTQPTDVANATMPLTPLANNGGPTQTNIPELGGVLNDAIPVGTPSLCQTGDTDQRGVSRPQDLGCEIGAVEGDNGVVAAGIHFTVNDSGDAPDTSPTDGRCRTATNVCTLRAAVAQTELFAGFPNTITIAPGVNPNLSIAGSGEDHSATGDLDVRVDLAIEGNGATITQSGGDRIFDVGAGGTTPTVSVHHATLTGGQADRGGAVLLEGGALTVTDSTVTANTAADGGGIDVIGGALTLNTSTLDHNTASSTTTSGRGGGLFSTAGTATGLDDTLTANSATGTAGMGGNVGEDGGDIELTYATITDGTAARGPGMGGTATGVVHATASILENTNGNCFGKVGSLGYTVASDGTCPFLLNSTDLVNTPVSIGALADNGGPTRTQAPALTSAAVDAPVPGGTPGLCDATFPKVDQRGVARWSGTGCDRGSFEVQQPISVTVNDAGDAHDASPGDGVCATSAGVCTLRAAVDETNAWRGPDTITIAAGINPTISLAGAGDDTNATGDLDVTDAVTIHGSGATIEAAGLDRAWHLHAAVVSMDHLTVDGGHASTGGDIQVDGGSLTLDHVTVEHGTATGAGGGIDGTGGATVTATSSSFVANQSGANGGGIELDANGSLSATASTFSGNAATGTNATGGGIDTDGTVSVVSSTVTGNRASFGGGIRGVGTLLRDTIAGNQAANGGSAIAGEYTIGGTILSGPIPICAASGFGTTVDLGYNQTGDGQSGQVGCFLQAATDQPNRPALLSSLAANGGPTATLLPYSDSQGVDAIPTGTARLCDASTPIDQRGVSRPAGSRCDIGAVEGTTGTAAPPIAITVNNGGDNLDDNPGDGVCHDVGGVAGQCSLRAAIEEADVDGRGTISIASGVRPTLSRTGEFTDLAGDIEVRARVSIHGNGATVDGAGVDRIFLVEDTLAVDHLTITGGHPDTGSGQQGGGIELDRTAGPVSLDSVTITGNTAASGGGIAASVPSNRGPLVIKNSTISANTAATQSGGGVFAAGGQVTITQSTFSGNTAANDGAGFFENTTFVEDTFAGNSSGGSGAIGLFVAGSDSMSGVVLADGATECDDNGNGLTSKGYNLSADASCGFTAATDRQNATASLGALADNGGPTLTRLPAASSALVDAIPIGTAGLCDSSTPTDQRGQPRPSGTGCDIGAVERQPSDL
jgi:CSLREA domain-containing protein